MSNDASNDKPTSVQWAVRCLWISVGLVVLLSIAPFLGVTGIPRDVVAMATNLVTVGLLAWVAIKVGAGRGWARWLFAAIYVLGSLGIIVSIFLMPEVFRSLPTVAKASGIVQFVLQSAALMLMFTHASRQWFNAKRAPNPP